MSMHVTMKQCAVGVVVVAALLAVFLAPPRPAGAEHLTGKNVVIMEASSDVLERDKVIIPTGRPKGGIVCTPDGEFAAIDFFDIPATIVLGMKKDSRQKIFWLPIPTGGRHIIVGFLGTCRLNGRGTTFNIYEVN